MSSNFRFVLSPAGLALACLAASSSPLALAQEVQRPVVVTGSLVPRTLGSEIAATSVLTRADLERAGATDLVAALNLLGSALVEQQGGTGAQAALRLRGADSRDTLVLVDGVPLNDVTTGAATIAQIPLALIERVEVVRGNLSALYGANATGGVVQVFTRRGREGWDAQATLGAGSRDTASASASVAAGNAALRGRLTAGYDRARGFGAIDPALSPAANPDDDGHRRRYAAFALDATPAEGHVLGLDLRDVRGHTAYDSAFGAPADVHEQTLDQRGATLRGRHRLAEAWSLGWRAGSAQERREDLGGTSNRLRNRLGAIDLDGDLGAGLKAQLGAERFDQTTDSAAYLQPRRRTDVLRAGLQFDAGWGGVQANVRRDDTSDFGAATTGLVGATWKFAPQWRAVATGSTSFTPPSLDFLYFDCSPFGFVCNNPDLQPERARNGELALQWDDGATLVRATAFRVRYRDKIAGDPLLDFRPNNIARAKNQGLELAARHTSGPWRFAGEAVWQDPVDAATGETLRRRAKRQLALRLDHDAGAWGGGAALRHVGTRPDSVPETGAPVTLPSYTVVDAALRWRFVSQWTLQGTLENLFDRAYQPAAHYQGRPRGVFVTLAWQAAQ
jgi:vitamin B12 transporter